MKKLCSLFLILLLTLSLVACGEPESTDTLSTGEPALSETLSDTATTDANSDADTETAITDTSSNADTETVITDTEISTDSTTSSKTTEEDAVEYETLKIYKYFMDHGYNITTKKLSDKWTQGLINQLLTLKETGVVTEKISDAEITETGYAVNKLPIPTPSYWLITENALFRYTQKKLYRVETHLGEGRELELPEEVREMIEDAIYYAPLNSYRGTLKDGTLEVNHVFKTENAVEISVEEITRNPDLDEYGLIGYKAKYTLLSPKDQTVRVSLSSRQSSDNYGSMDSKTVELKANQKITLEYDFLGWKNAGCYFEISAGQSHLQITIHPPK